MGGFGHGRLVVALVAAATLLGGGATPALAAPAGSVRVGANARLSASPLPVRGPDLPGLAVDPANARHLVEVDENFLTGFCEYHVSFDGGTTWAGGNLRVPSGFGSQSCHQLDIGGYGHSAGSVAFGAGQDVYTTFSAQKATLDQSVLVAKSTDGGRTFTTAVVAMAGPASGKTVYQRPELTATPSRVYVDAWVGTVLGSSSSFGSSKSKVPGCGSPCGYQIAVANSADGGSTWSAPVPTGAQTAPAQSVPSAPIGIDREQSQPAVTADGDLYVAWRSLVTVKPDEDYLVVGKSTDSGATWTTTVVGGTGNKIAGLRAPKLAAGPSNTVYVAYQTKVSAGSDIRVVGSSDGGSTWSSPAAPVDHAAIGHAGAPQIAVSGSGRVDVVWYDSRNSPASAHFEDVYESSSTDAGRTFSADRRITDRSINFDTGLYNELLTAVFYTPAIASVGHGADRVAWTDSRLGNFTTSSQDIYQATVQFGASGPIPESVLASSTASKPSVADVSIGLSNLAYPGGAEAVGTKPRRSATKVVIVNSGDPAAALVGSVLARANFGPVLTSGAGGLSAQVKSEVSRLQATGAYIVGSTASLGSGVIAGVEAAGVPSAATIRVTGASPAATAAAVATMLDSRTAAQKSAHKAAFGEAVIVNPASPDAGAASALAATLGDPILFVGTGSVPAPTAAALRSLDITKTLVVGGVGSVADNLASQLPGASRLGGADAAATSQAVDAQYRGAGLPVNVAYVVNPSNAMGAALAGAAVARLGGILLLAPGAAAASASLSHLGLSSVVDRLVLVPKGASSGGGVPTWAIVVIAIAIVLIIAGLVLLILVRRRSRLPVAA